MQEKRIAASSSFVDGNWHHLVVTRSGTSVRVYLDATSLGCNTRGSGALSYRYANTLLTGQEQDNTTGNSGFADNQSLRSQLDEFKVFGNALSSAQVASIRTYESAGKNWDGSVRAATCGVLVADYHMDGSSWNGTSGEVVDSSSNAYNATRVVVQPRRHLARQPIPAEHKVPVTMDVSTLQDRPIPMYSYPPDFLR